MRAGLGGAVAVLALAATVCTEARAAGGGAPPVPRSLVAPQAPNIGAAYAAFAAEGRPLLITPDAAFEELHFAFESALQRIEEETWSGELSAALDELHGAAPKGFARDYISVARALLSDEDEGLAGAALAEFDKVKAAAEPEAASPLFGYREDYTQYQARGHYAKSPRLSAWFRSVTWLGRLGFPLEPGKGLGVDEASAVVHAERALAMGRLLAANPGARARLARIERAWGRWLGPADDASLLAFDAHASTATVDPASFRAHVLGAAQRPRIAGSFVAEGEKPPLSLKVLPQRLLPDALVLHALTFDRLGQLQGAGQPATMSTTRDGRRVRGTPRGLDVVAALGSEVARAELKRAGDDAYLGFDAGLAQATGELTRLLAKPESLPARVLAAAGYAAVEADPALAAPLLPVNSALGAWALMRHDLLAYGKQSYTAAPRSMGVAGVDPPAPRLRVVRAPRTFKALAEAATSLATSLEEWQRTDDAVSLRTLAGRLEMLANHAGANIPAPEAAQWAAAWARAAGRGALAVVADVHTDGNSGKALQVAVGAPVAIEATLDGVAHAAVVFAYFEFRQPVAQRMTDETWRLEAESQARRAARFDPLGGR